MKGGGARARLDGLESQHCKWGNRISPTQWTKIEALLAGLTVASREPDRSHPAMHPAFRLPVLYATRLTRVGSGARCGGLVCYPGLIPPPHGR